MQYSQGNTQLPDCFQRPSHTVNLAIGYPHFGIMCKITASQMKPSLPVFAASYSHVQI